MNIFAWIGMIGILVFAWLPFLKEEYRTKFEVLRAVVTTLTVMGIILAVMVFHVHFVLAFLAGLMVFILLDSKTYTKVRLIIYGAIIPLIIGGVIYFFLRDNPDLVLNHLAKHRESTSFFAVKNGEDIVAYEADRVRPLASTVKILIAAEYAMQIEAGKLNRENEVPLADLKRYYLKDTDGGAHERWLEEMEKNKEMKNGKVALDDVARGMITYSSNTNTDYLIDLLGIDDINRRAKELGLKSHEPVYPIVGALLIPYEEKGMTVEELRKMDMEEYRKRAVDISRKMKTGKVKAENISYDGSLKFQRVWSDRLIGANAHDYGKLLAIISRDELPEAAAAVMKDLMEWPMDINPDNQKRFRHLGAKGGSTAFILNDAIYAEELGGDRYELVVLMDDLKLWESLVMQRNLNAFQSKFMGSPEYQRKAKERLEGEKRES